MSMQPPTPVEYASDGSNEEEYYAYYERQLDYMFKTQWLAIALTPEEFAKTELLAVPLLIDLYPDIRIEGPMGAVWYNQLRSMRQIFDFEVPEIDPLTFLDDFITTYKNLTTRYSHDNEIWNFLKQETSEDWNSQATYPDVDSYHSGPVVDVANTRLFARLARKDDPRISAFYDAQDDHARMVLLSYIMRTMTAPAIVAVLAAHDAFVARYRLDA